MNKHKHSNAPSILGADLTITGDLTTEGEIHIDGTVNGNISADKLTVGEHAHVVGDIRTREIIIQGEVRGLINSDIVQLSQTAKVRGNIVWHNTLGIETGAHFDGQCKHADTQTDTGSPITTLETPDRFAQHA